MTSTFDLKVKFTVLFHMDFLHHLASLFFDTDKPYLAHCHETMCLTVMFFNIISFGIFNVLAIKKQESSMASICLFYQDKMSKLFKGPCTEFSLGIFHGESWDSSLFEILQNVLESPQYFNFILYCGGFKVFFYS